MWFLSNYFYNYGLSSTSVSSSTVLCNTSSIFVYIFGIILLEDVKFNILKALIVCVSFSGIVCVALSDRNDQSQSNLKGNLFSLLSASFYGLYSVFLKKKIPIEKEPFFKFSYFLGFVGLFNSFLLLPLFPILHYLNIEIFGFPNKKALLALSLNAILGTVISDYCWARSVILNGPLITTLGITLTIPISMIIDCYFENK